MSVKDYALDPDLNTAISGINIAEGCPPSGINDAIRQLMADIRQESEAQAQAREQAMEETGNLAADDAAAKVAALDAALREVIAEVRAGTEQAQASADAAQASADAVQDALLLAVPPGTVMAFAANATPEGWLLCNGAAVSRSTYAALFAAIGTIYGAGDGSSTFALPNLNNRFIQGSGTAGTVKNAGLPNHTHIITSSFSLTKYIGGQGSTADYVRPQVGSTKTTTTAASASSSIYGASSTVQPPALTMRFYIRY